MSFSIVSNSFQITIPEDVRNALDIKKNDKIFFVLNGDQVILEKISGNILDIKLPSEKQKKKIDFGEAREFVKKWRGRRST